MIIEAIIFTVNQPELEFVSRVGRYCAAKSILVPGTITIAVA